MPLYELTAQLLAARLQAGARDAATLTELVEVATRGLAVGQSELLEGARRAAEEKATDW